MKLEQLPEYTESVFNSLKADQSLKYRICKTAATQTNPEREKYSGHFVPVLCSVIALLLFSAVLLNSLRPVSYSDQGEIIIFAAGSNQTDPPEPAGSLDRIIREKEPSEVLWIETDEGIRFTVPDKCYDLFTLIQKHAEKVDFVPDASDTGSVTIKFSDGSEKKINVSFPYLIDENAVWKCEAFFEAMK